MLIDLVLSKIYKGAKEIDISATLEHLRDQRSGAVTTKVRPTYFLFLTGLSCFETLRKKHVLKQAKKNKVKNI